MIVAIDGPAGSGKSTVAKRVAQQLKYNYLDTGAMYRAITYEALKNDIDIENSDALTHLARSAKLEFRNEHMGIYSDIFINGQRVTDEIRLPEVDANVSAVSKVAGVREAMVRKQRQLAGNDAIIEGRDIGTVVFPDAKLKVFLTAGASERARRRALQLESTGEKIDSLQVQKEIIRRDQIDSNRENSPLVKAVDAVELETTDKDIEQVVREILLLIKNAL